MQINDAFSRLLKSVKIETRSLPVSQTPPPEKNKVIGEPTRVPINKQAALIIQPIRSWIYRPLPPAKLPNPYQQEMEEVRAMLKTERNAHALTRDALGNTRQNLKEAKARICHLEKLVMNLRMECQNKSEIIAQLEDLKL